MAARLLSVRNRRARNDPLLGCKEENPGWTCMDVTIHLRFLSARDIRVFHSKGHDFTFVVDRERAGQDHIGWQAWDYAVQVNYSAG